MSTIKDVAKKAGVSVATVSRYINNSGYVSQQSAEEIEKAIKELNYTPNEVARSLYNKKSKLVVLLVPQIDNPYFSHLIKGVEKVLKDKGYQLIISNVNNTEEENLYISAFKNNNIAGIISAVGISEDIKINCPIVGVDRHSEKFKYAVYFDEYNGGKKVGLEISKTDSKAILLNRGPEDVDVSNYRFMGIKEVLDSKKINYDIFTSSNFGYEGANELENYIKENINKYDTIIACNDLHALMAGLCLQNEGKCIPDDVQIIGYDNIIYSRVFNPKIATVSHSGEELGRIASNMLINLIEGNEIEYKKVELMPQLILNQSLRK